MSVPSAVQSSCDLVDGLFVVGDVDGGDIVGDRAGIGQRLPRHPVQIGDRHDHRVVDVGRIERA